MLENTEYKTSRPNLTTLLPQALSLEHSKQANLGFDKAFVAASYVEFDLDAFNIIEGDKGEYINIKNTQMVGQKISILLPDFKAPVFLEVETAQNLITTFDIVTYTGTVSKQKNSRFVLSVSAQEGIIATINIGKYVYNILPLKDTNKHVVSKIFKSQIPRNTKNDVFASAALEKAVASQHNSVRSSNGNGLVKVLFYAASDVTSPYSKVSNIVAEMNAILAASQVSANNRIATTDVVQVYNISRCLFSASGITNGKCSRGLFQY